MEFVYFSFVQGVVAFFAPCAVALLPGYIVAYITRGQGSDPDTLTKAFRGLKLAMLAISGILVIYSIAGVLIVLASQILKEYMKWVTVLMGAALIIVGIFMIFGKSFAISLNVNTASKKSESVEAVIFGMAYAIGALGCLFPLFLIVATQALAAPTAWLGASYIAAYFTGISLMMIGTILLSTFAKKLFMSSLQKILPYMEQITGVLLIAGGVYVIYYQMVLF